MWSSPLTDTPCIIQTSFGAFGQYLPDDGADYCAPTALTMSLYYLLANGFTQLAPTAFAGQDAPESINFERAIAGLLGTAGRGGTTGLGYDDGLTAYMSMCGISTSYYSTVNTSKPNLDDFDTILSNNWSSSSTTIALTTFSVGWFELSSANEITFNGGHVLTPLQYDASSQYLTLNNPAPYSFGGRTAEEQECQQTVYLSVIPSSWTYNGQSNLPWLQISWEPLTADQRGIAIVNSLAALLVDGTAAQSQGFTPQPWTLSGNAITVDTNGATLDAIAPIGGTSSLVKMGQGTFRLSNTVETTSSHYVVEGTLESICAGGTPFGTGSIFLQGDAVSRLNSGGTLRLTSETASIYTVASAPGAQLTFGTGASLYLAGAATFAVMVGGNDNVSPTAPLSGQNLVRSGRGTLELAVDDLADFGDSQTIEIVGTGSNLPTLADGFIPPYIIATGRPVVACGPCQGQFLTYGSSHSPVLTAAETVSSANTSINDIGDDSAAVVYAVVDAQTIAGGDRVVTVAALSIADATLDCNSGIIAIGDSTTAQCGGLILSGATVSNGTIAFAGSEGLIWMGGETESLSASITGTNGLTFFGPGQANLTGANTDVQGDVNVNGGTLLLAGAGTLGDQILVNEGASLIVSGTVSSAIRVSGTGTLTLDQGVIQGDLTTTLWASSSSAVGSTLAGCGTITQPLTVYGLIKAGPSLGFLTFQQKLTIAEKSTFVWSLGAYESGATPAGSWNAISLEAASTIGFPKENLAIGLDFSILGEDPDQSSNAFWTTKQAWVLFLYEEQPAFAAQILDNRFKSGLFCLKNDPHNTIYGNGTAWNLVWTPS